MKKVILLLLMVTLSFAQGYIEFAKEMGYETKYEAALAKAKKEQKNLMILMVTNYCPWCAKFEKNTLSDTEIDSIVKSKYIPLILNKKERNFPQYLNTPIVPTTFFVDPNEEKEYYKQVGFSNEIDFLDLLKEIK